MKVLKYSPYFVLIAGVLWALDGVLRRQLFSLPPITIVFFEHLIGLVLLLPFIWKPFFRERLRGYEWGLVMVVALLSGVIGTLCFTAALVQVQFISFSVVFLLQKLQPVFATLGAVLMLREKLTVRYLIWAAVALVSAFFVTFPMGVVNFDTGNGTVIAAFLALGAAFAWGTSTVFSKELLRHHSHQLITGYRFLFTTLFSGLAMLLWGSYVLIPSITLPQYGYFLAIAISTGMVALLIYYKGLKHTEAKIATLLELSFPLLAVGIDAYLYNSFLQPSQLVAAVVLLISFTFLSRLNYAVEIR